VSVCSRDTNKPLNIITAFMMIFFYICVKLSAVVGDSAVGVNVTRYLEGTMTHSCRVPAAE